MRWIVCFATLMAIPGVAAAAGVPRDATVVALDRCLALPANASTAGQTDCEAAAMRSYDRRMNVAYAALMRRLPAAGSGGRSPAQVAAGMAGLPRCRGTGTRRNLRE